MTVDLLVPSAQESPVDGFVYKVFKVFINIKMLSRKCFSTVTIENLVK